MTDEQNDVNKADTTADVEQQEDQTNAASEGDINSDSYVQRDVYESVREAMKKSREEAKRLKAEIASLKSSKQTGEGHDRKTQNIVESAKIDLVYSMQKDSFIRENIELIEDKMVLDNCTVQEAVQRLKSEMFDKIISKSDEHSPQSPPKQLIPKGSNAEIGVQKSSVEQMLANAPVGQVEAYKRALERIK